MADTPVSGHVPVGRVQPDRPFVVRDTPLVPCQVHYAVVAASASVTGQLSRPPARVPAASVAR